MKKTIESCLFVLVVAGCGSVPAEYDTPPDAAISQNTDATAPKADTHVPDSSPDVANQSSPENLAFEEIWTSDELAELSIGTAGVARTVLQGFDLVDLPVTLSGYANIDTDSTKPYLLFHGVAGESGVNPWKKWGGAAAGMSGSPIIIEGRVAAALSYGLSWPEHTEPFQFGATPAHLMAELAGGQVAANKPSSDASASGMKSLGLLSISGGQRYVHLFEDAMAKNGFEPSLRLATSGSARGIKASEIPKLVPGSAIAIPLVMPEGDMGMVSAASIGTVTFMDDEKLWAFGHPLGMSGKVALPYTAAWIDSTFGDVGYAFKVGVSVGPILGTIVEDRTTAIVGVQSAMPKMILSVSQVRTGSEIHTFRHLMADTTKIPHVAFLPAVIGYTALAPMDSVVDQIATEATVVASFGIKVAGSSVPAKFRIVASTFDPTTEVFYQNINQLLNLTSGWGEVQIEQVESDLWYEPGLKVATIDYLELPNEITPGGSLTATLHYHLKGTWAEQMEEFTFDLSEDFEPGVQLSVRVGPKIYDHAFEMDGECNPIYPQTVEEWVEHFNSRTTDADEVEVVLQTQDTGLQKCLEACAPDVELDPEAQPDPDPKGGGDFDPAMEDPGSKCMMDCETQFKCVKPQRLVKLFSLPSHVISGEAIGSSQISMDVP